MAKKVAILGGGLGAMVTAMQLSDPNNPEKLDITVYQMGWRIGGKGASGRNPDAQNRIEEHGLHLWFGFYDHAFDVIKKCYAENNRPLTQPLATWNQAFKPCNFYALQEHIDEEWIKWELPFPQNDLEPGLGGKEMTLWEYATELTKLALENYEKYQKPIEEALSQHNFALKGLVDLKNGILGSLLQGMLSSQTTTSVGYYLLQEIQKAFANPEPPENQFAKEVLMALLELFLKISQEVVDDAVKDNDVLRRMWILINLATAGLLGFLKDDVFAQGLGVLNKYDYKEWLKQNGASDLAVNSPVIDAIYCAFFSRNMTFEAGTAVNLSLKLALKYRGSFYYRMQAGMGDTIFTPVYEVLKKRGVKFKFFHKVERLVMSEDQQNIERVEGGVQVNLKNSDEEYMPLIDVKGLPCWPSFPLYDQILEAEELKAQNIDLECHWTPWKNVDSFSLQKGVDYDHLVLGISVKSLETICAEVIEAKPAWKTMMEKIVAVPTQAMQLWFTPDVAGLGWEFWRDEEAFLSAYMDNPVNTWADMSELIVREDWQSPHVPNHIAYYCSNYMPAEPIPPASETEYPAEQLKMMEDRSINALNENLSEIFPKAVDRKGFNWDLLVDPKNNTGKERLKSQYLRVNLSPSELYVLCVKGSSQYRLTAGGSGFDNLTLTGDWIDNEVECMSAGFVEGTVLAGLRAAEVALAKL